MPLPRRSLLAGLGLTLAAPAIVRTPGLLMPVCPPRPLRLLTASDIEWTESIWDGGDEMGVGGEFRTSDGRWLRHAAATRPEYWDDNKDICKQMVIDRLNEIRRAEDQAWRSG